MLVANATGDVGAACAHRLASAGAPLMVSGTDDEAVERLEADLAQHGVAVYGYAADLAHAREVEALLGEGLRVFGAFEGAVVALAEPAPGTLRATDDAAVDKALAGGVRAAYVLCQRLARVMSAGGGIVLVGPGGAVPCGPAAAMVRGAVTALARDAADELREQHVRVHAVVGGGDDRAAQVAAVAELLLAPATGSVGGTVVELGV